MSKFKSEFLNVMQSRGFLYQCTDEENLDKLFLEGPVTAYIGFDCTATSLHVGNLVSIMTARWLQKTGNNPIILIGGATTKVGDPSGKDETRKLLEEEGIEKNISGIRSSIEKFVEFGNEENKAKLVNNSDWLEDIKYIDFLREYGRHFAVNRMLAMESVKNRLEREQNLSFLEFNYMILQAYDFVMLNREYGCKLQIGGSDQWGNIVNGTELNRRIGGEDIFGLTTHLITTSSGAKMGKTAEGAMWLNEDELSPYDYWQFWRNTEDADVGRFLKLFTELDIEEIEKLESLQGAEINEAKIILANEATKMCHGEEAAKNANSTASKAFTSGSAGEDLPTITVKNGTSFAEVFISLGFTESKKAFRRLVEGGGAKKNGQPITSFDETASESDKNEEGVVMVASGKKKFGIVKLEA